MRIDAARQWVAAVLRRRMDFRQARLRGMGRERNCWLAREPVRANAAFGSQCGLPRKGLKNPISDPKWRFTQEAAGTNLEDHTPEKAGLTKRQRDGFTGWV